jgi:hypothetical protein
LQITVIAMGGRDLEVSKELALVKAALLYADHVVLADPKVVLLTLMDQLTGKDAEAVRRQVIDDLITQLPGGKQIQETRAELAKRRGRRSRNELLTALAIERQFAETTREIGSRLDQMLAESGAREFAGALRAGVLELDLLGAETGNVATEHITDAIKDRLAKVLSPGAGTYPLFDDQMGGLAKAMVREGHVPGAVMGPAKHVGVASALITTLAAFPAAPMDVVLDVREKLRAPLIRFRSAVATMADVAEALPFDAAFADEVERLYRSQVAPALEELAQIADELRLRNALPREVPVYANALTKAGLAFAVSRAANFPDVAQAALGVAVPLTELGVSVAQRRRELKETQRKNQFYFLYEADQQLARR